MNFLGSFEQRRGGEQRGHLRLLRGGQRPDRDSSREHDRVELAVPGPHPARSAKERAAAQASSRILVAGADPQQRAAVLRELSEALPEDTQFGEAGAAWEVLEQASSSGVVMLAGDLAEVTAESLMNVLGHRHPRLPVVALGVLTNNGPAHGGHSSRAASATG
ncbi:MAG TPA: hypothetical protein VGI76_07125 [Solirubrobacteraceae bacterium]|jgi:hypothetical protein